MLTDNSTVDSKVYPDFLEKSPKSVKRTYGDGAYDKEICYAANTKYEPIPIIPPQRNAIFHPNAPPHMQSRNKAYLEILGLGGDDQARKTWKILKGYHRRSLAETGMFRFKQLFGNSLKSRDLPRQRAKVRAKCEAMNIMTRLGMPVGKWVMT